MQQLLWTPSLLRLRWMMATGRRMLVRWAAPSNLLLSLQQIMS
jgi:hypothetical protein